MTDIELLELAAKAEGRKTERIAGKLWVEKDTLEWNPLTNDGDALRLAVKLRLMLSWHEPKELRVIWWNAEERKEIVETWTETHDSCACSRQAIVRAAAEIGKEMK